MAGEWIPVGLLFNAGFPLRQQDLLLVDAKDAVDGADELREKVHVEVVAACPALDNSVLVVDAELDEADDLEDD